MYEAYNDMLPYNLQIYIEKSNCGRQIHCFKQKILRTTKKTALYTVLVSYCGVKFWNSLDNNLKMCNTVNLYKKYLKKYYYLLMKKIEYKYQFSSQLL